MDIAELRAMLADAPLYLRWSRQGHVWWDEEWLEARGPIRTRIPDFDDHISFANFDLRFNELPPIQTTSEGRPYVMGITPLSREELATVHGNAIVGFSSPWQVDSFLREEVFARLAIVASVLNVVHYHGFDAWEVTPGLKYLRQVLPPRDPTRVEYRRE